MSLIGLKQSVLIDVKANVDQAKSSLGGLARQTDANTDAIAKFAKAQDSAMAGMSRTGLEGESAFGKVTGALTRLNFSTEAVKKGIEVARKGLAAYGETSLVAAAQVARIEGAATHAFDAVMVSIGKATVSLGPLIEGLSAVVVKLADVAAFSASGVGDTIGFVGMGFSDGIKRDFLGRHGMGVDDRGEWYANDARRIYSEQHGGNVADFDKQMKLNAERDKLEAIRKAAEPKLWDTIGAGLTSAVETGMRRGLGVDQWGGGGSAVEKALSRGGGSGSGPKAEFTTGMDWGDMGTGAFNSRGARAVLEGQSLGSLATSVPLDDFGNEIDPLAKFMTDETRARTEEWFATLARIKGEQQTFLENTFGTLAEFNAYGDAFRALTDGVQSGYGAMVDGTESFGTAFKKAIADSIKASGSLMLVEAIKNTAYGFAALARYDLPGAGNHFVSAAKFGAGAAIAGLTASYIGTSAGVAHSDAQAKEREREKSEKDRVGSGGGRGSLGSGGSSGSPQPIRIIVYADAFAEDSERGKRATAEKIVARALGSGVVENS